MVEYDPKTIVKQFFEASLYKHLDDFDFDNAFSVLGQHIYQKLVEHGLISFDAFKDFEEEILCVSRDHHELSDYASETNYIYISVDDIHDAIMEYRYNKMRDTFKDYESFKELLQLHEDILNSKLNPTSDNVLLMERLIHAQHETGEIFEDFNPDDIRADVEAEYKKLMSGEI